MTSGESAGDRWKRRRVTIPTMLAASTAAFVFAPVLLPGVVIFDLVHGRRRLPTLRTYLFVCQYLCNDSIEILAAGPLWLAAGFGRSLNETPSQHRHQQLQAWSIGVLARRAESLLGIRINTIDGGDQALTPAPAIVICRHVSVFDASLPALLYQRLGIHTRGVIMAELLADPGFDLLYQRSGSVFIARDNNPEAVALSAAVTNALDTNTVAVIFPEGRLFRPELLAQLLKRLEEKDPQRAKRLASLRHLLPPRAGGLIALLDAAPNADIVVINHAGLDRYPAFADVARQAPLTHPIKVTVQRIPRADVPVTPAERHLWLDELWCRMDDWVDQQLT